MSQRSILMGHMCIHAMLRLLTCMSVAWPNLLEPRASQARSEAESHHVQSCQSVQTAQKAVNQLFRWLTVQPKFQQLWTKYCTMSGMKNVFWSELLQQIMINCCNYHESRASLWTQNPFLILCKVSVRQFQHINDCFFWFVPLMFLLTLLSPSLCLLQFICFAF